MLLQREKLADANKHIEELRQQTNNWVEEMLEENRDLERTLVMHNAGGPAVLSGEVPKRRGARREWLIGIRSRRVYRVS